MQPEPVTFRIQQTRISPQTLLDRLKKKGFRIRKHPWHPDFFEVVQGPYPISKTLEHWLGYFYIQQVSTGILPYVLTIHPDTCFLDICSAPGGKLVHLYDVSKGQGTFVAGELQSRRLKALQVNVYRFGLWNVLTYRLDGRSLPSNVLFDAILVDVPCTSQGNVRDSDRARKPVSQRFLRYITRTQEVLLERAIDTARVGATILYVTCTFAPEENENILTRILSRLPVKIVPIDLPVPHDTGWSEFEGQKFHPDCVHAIRIYPHHLNSGGLFLAKLVKTDQTGSRTKKRFHCSSNPPPSYWGDDMRKGLAAGEIYDFLEYLRTTFGLEPDLLETFSWTYWKNAVWAHRCQGWPSAYWKSAPKRKLNGIGVRAGLKTPAGWRPDSHFLRLMGNALKKNVIECNRDEWIRLLQGQFLKTSDSNRYVALSYKGEVIGCGRIRNRQLRVALPPERARLLEDIIKLESDPV